MTTPVWQPGTLYPNGSLVRPVSAPPPAATAIPNPGFESGDTGWTKGTGWTINSGDQPFQGTWSAKYNNTGTSNLDMDTTSAVSPGQSITASCMVQQGASSAGQAGATVALVWLTAADAVISVSQGNTVDSASGGAWQQSTVTAVAPATAAKVKVRAIGFRNSGTNPLWVDSFTWNHVGAVAPAGLIYRAVQTGVGTSGSEEPTWPLTLGVQVVDATVTWEAVTATRVTWQANPLLTSSGTEPTWPTEPGGTVLDGNILWECVSRRVEDENCPNSKVVAIVASKVFAADGDIVRFSETANPLNWTTEQDAGYLPTGLQQANANDMAVLNQYRSNLVAFNASSFQNWYVDPDPANMSILDQMDGIGSTWQQAAQSVGNELFYLSQLGVRSVGIANAAENLSAGDVGQPIDPLIRAEIATAAAGGFIPIATYYPGSGQYWLAFTESPGGSGSSVVISNPLTVAYLDVAVTHQYAVTGGTGPYTFVIDRGALPDGLAMDSLGRITGTPTVAGSFAWRVRVYDSMLRTDYLDQGINIAEGIDAGEVFEVGYAGTWMYGPVAQNGASGGSELFYLKANTPTGLYSATPVALPAQGSGSLVRLSIANGAVFMHRGANGSVSFDNGATWAQCSIGLSSTLNVFWDGSFYFNGGSRSADGITWSAITTFPGTATQVALARPSDGAVVCVSGTGASTQVYVSTDSGATWTMKWAAGATVPTVQMTTNGTRIWFDTAAIVKPYYTDNLFTSVAPITSSSNNGKWIYANNAVMIGAAVRDLWRMPAGAITTVKVIDNIYNGGANNQGDIAYGGGVWAAENDVNNGVAPKQRDLFISSDDGFTWAAGGGTLYGDGGSLVYAEPTV